MKILTPYDLGQVKTSSIVDRGAREAQQQRALSALSQNQNLVPSAHIKGFTTSYNSISKGFSALFWSPGEPVLICTYPHTDAHH